jgi:3-dehydroquinate synthase
VPPICVTHATGSYEVHVSPGIAAEATTRIAAALPGRRLAILTDNDIYHALITAGPWPPITGEIIPLPPGEAAKSRTQWANITDALLEMGFGRDSAIVAVGGGSVGDLAGFVASTYLRGIPYVQVPTTLLAMVDASVGGKVGVDTPAGKNLVGAFHPPALVLADPRLLATLPDAVYREGLAEAVKHGVVADAGYFEWLGDRVEEIGARDPATIEELVRRSVEIKAGVVSRDEHETGERAILNAGHTIGHALEMLSGFTLRHGDAVAAGLVAEAQLAETLGVAEPGTSETIFALLASLGLPGTEIAFTREVILPLMRNDKKNRGGKIRMALPRTIGTMARDGDAWTVAIPESHLTG